MRKNIVKLNQITSAADVAEQIDLLTQIKEEQEIMLKHNLKAFSHLLNPGAVLKRTLFKVAEDDELKQSAFKTSLNLGAQFVLDKLLLGKGIGIKSYILNMALKKVASFLISKNSIPSLHK